LSFAFYQKNIIFANKSKMESKEYYMKQALGEARRAFDLGEVPIGAVVVCDGRIIARAHNLTETLNDVTAHAEMLAITSAATFLGGKYLVDCTLFVTVEPCPMCAGALCWAQVGGVVFGAEDEKRGYRRWAPEALHPKTEITAGVLAEEAAALMVQFFKDKR
jgi:tRNA(adenine34) deaminase